MSHPQTEELSEFNEFIEQINELQRMQSSEQEALNRQRLQNVELLEELFKAKRKQEVLKGQYASLNFQHAQLHNENEAINRQLNIHIQENEQLMAKEIELQRTLDSLRKKQQDEIEHMEKLQGLTRIMNRYVASLECSSKLKDLQHQLHITNDKKSSLDLQLASYLESSNDRTLTNQATDLNEEILTLDARIEKAKDELNAVISQSKEQYAMMDEDYYSTMAEVVRLDNESQQLELLFEKESMETQALKYELTQREK